MGVLTRRRFLETTGGSFAGLAGLGILPPVSAAEAKAATPVELRPEIEPLVRLLETTPRDRLLEEVGDRIRKGLSYRELLAALFLAGVRNVEPRPSVGFKFHAVLVVHSAHLASLSGPASDRWLPLFWALDYFKHAQARDVEQNDWTMAPVDESAVPPPRRARKAFTDAMERWDADAADAAVAGLARSAGAHEVFDLMFCYGARDFRSIGHKAIFVANGYRALRAIGWQHAEPVLRSMTYALLNHHGDANPAKSDLPPDRPWRENQTLVEELRPNWQAGERDADAIPDLLKTLRAGSAKEASKAVVSTVNRGVAPRSVWDALFQAGGELLVRRPGITSLHAMTTTNALYQAYLHAADTRTRQLVLLQNAAFLTRFRGSLGPGGEDATHIDTLEPAEVSSNGEEAVEEIFSEVSDSPLQASRKALSYLNGGGDPDRLMDTARKLLFMKGNDPHDYKFTSAVLEDYYHVTPPWRNRYLASGFFRLCGPEESDNNLVKRARAALEG